jgi:hypothetical protein
MKKQLKHQQNQEKFLDSIFEYLWTYNIETKTFTPESLSLLIDYFNQQSKIEILDHTNNIIYEKSRTILFGK